MSPRNACAGFGPPAFRRPRRLPGPRPRRTGRQLPFTPARTSGEAIIIGRADPGDLRAGAASSIAVLYGRILGVIRVILSSGRAAPVLVVMALARRRALRRR
jgi:hypothetical protein